MATIPTLIVAPAILAAGIAYRYAGGSEPEARKSQARPMQRRLSEADARAEVGSAAAGGGRFEQDFQPRVPTQRQLVGTFIPTSLLGPALQAQAAAGGGSPGDEDTLSSRKALYGMSGGPAELAPEHAGRYPRTTEEIEHSSWLQRAARSITGDLGPIEHQERVVSMQHAGDSQTAESAEPTPRYFVRESVGAGDGAVRDVERAADGARTWFWAKSKEVDEDIDRMAVDAQNSATQAFDETQGWFWSKKKEVDDDLNQMSSDINKRASEVAESTRDAADQARGWYVAKKKEVDDDLNKTASDLTDHTKKAYDDAQHWYASKKKEVDDAAAAAADDFNKQANEVAESARDAADQTRGWYRAKKEEVDDDLNRMSDDVADHAKKAYDETQGWFRSKKKEADDVAHDIRRRASDVSASARQGAEEAAAAAARDVTRRASDASESAKQAADSTWSWLWSKKTEVDEAAASAIDSAKDQAESARESVAATSQQTKDALHGVAETAGDWVADKKASVADSARQSAGDACDWVEDTADDVSRSLGRADDISRAWLWSVKGEADQAIADTAGAVQQRAEAASNSAWESADAAARSYWQRGLDAGTGWRPSAETTIDETRDDSFAPQKQRRDSLLSGIDDNSVIHALDEKFNEARSILRSTTDEIKTMASDASSAASETLRTAAEKTLPRPSNDGINMEETHGHRDIANQARFVEANSHIPLLSSSPRKRT